MQISLNPDLLSRQQMYFRVLPFSFFLWAVGLWSGCFAQGVLEILGSYRPALSQQEQTIREALIREASELLTKILKKMEELASSSNMTEVVMEMLKNYQFKTPALENFLKDLNLKNLSDSDAPYVLQVITSIVQKGKEQPPPTDTGTCEDTPIFILLMGYMVVPMFLVCLFGNTFNVAVYTMEYFQKFVAVKMLAVKAVMNTLFVLCLIPKSLRVLELWHPIKHQTAEKVFWYSWPYLLTAMNTFGMCAMWLTVFMTLERYLYIVWPTKSRKWVTSKNFYLSFAVLFLITINLQAVYLYTRYVLVQHFSLTNLTVYSFVQKENSIYLNYEKIYHWLNLWFAIVIPLLLLIFMSAVISYKLLYQHSTAARYSEQKRCINRITFSTTIVHLILELPYVLIFGVAAIHGPRHINEVPFLCYYHIVASFLNICNASVLFFIYMAFSSAFRQMFMIRISCRRFKRRSELEDTTAPGTGGGLCDTGQTGVNGNAKRVKVVKNHYSGSNSRRRSDDDDEDDELKQELVPFRNSFPQYSSAISRNAVGSSDHMNQLEKNSLVVVEVAPLKDYCEDDTVL